MADAAERWQGGAAGGVEEERMEVGGWHVMRGRVLEADEEGGESSEHEE